MRGARPTWQVPTFAMLTQEGVPRELGLEKVGAERSPLSEEEAVGAGKSHLHLT